MSRVNRSEIVLRVLEGVSLLAVAMVAPNALQYLGAELGQGKWKKQRTYEYKKVLQNLHGKGFVDFKKNHQGILCAAITRKGQAELQKYDLGKLEIKKPKKWDGKYRIIIFDIKEWRRGVRDELRAWLAKLGFVRLQNSVWVCPYECEEVIALLKANFKIGKDVLYITADKIENDYWLKREFELL